MLENWIIRLMGGGILLLASLVYGRGKAAEEKRKVQEVEAFLHLMKAVEEEIEHTRHPLPKIFADYRNELLEGNGFLPAVRVHGIRAAWRSLERVFCLPEGTARKAIAVFCEEIGHGYQKEELELCKLTRSRLEDERTRLGKECGNRVKLYHTIPPIMVLSLMLILL